MLFFAYSVSRLEVSFEPTEPTIIVNPITSTPILFIVFLSKLFLYLKFLYRLGRFRVHCFRVWAYIFGHISQTSSITSMVFYPILQAYSTELSSGFSHFQSSYFAFLNTKAIAGASNNTHLMLPNNHKYYYNKGRFKVRKLEKPEAKLLIRC